MPVFSNPCWKFNSFRSKIIKKHHGFVHVLQESGNLSEIFHYLLFCKTLNFGTTEHIFCLHVRKSPKYGKFMSTWRGGEKDTNKRTRFSNELKKEYQNKPNPWRAITSDQLLFLCESFLPNNTCSSPRLWRSGGRLSFPSWNGCSLVSKRNKLM